MTSDFVSFIARADNWSENHMAFCFDSEQLVLASRRGTAPQT